jgi:hypothetical protein
MRTCRAPAIDHERAPLLSAAEKRGERNLHGITRPPGDDLDVQPVLIAQVCRRIQEVANDVDALLLDTECRNLGIAWSVRPSARDRGDDDRQLPEPLRSSSPDACALNLGNTSAAISNAPRSASSSTGVPAGTNCSLFCSTLSTVPLTGAYNVVRER